MDPYAPPSAPPTTPVHVPLPRRRLVVSTIGAASIIVTWNALLLGYFLPRFELIYRELGIQLPRLTLWVIDPWIHVLVGSGMLGLTAWRYRQSWRRWLTHVLVVLLGSHILTVIIGLLMPVIGLREQVG